MMTESKGSGMLTKLIKNLKENPRRIVFTEGEDHRIQEAASRLKKEGYLTPIMIGNPDKVQAAAKKNGIDIDGIEIVDIKTFPKFDEFVAKMVELRKGKMDEAACRAALSKSNYFGTMYVKMGYADALLGGATYSTADTVRPALQLIKTKPGNKIVSSCFVLDRPKADGSDEMYVMADCAINIDPSDDDLVEIALESAKTARFFDMEPKVAVLSYSTKGSGKGDSVDKMRSATEKILAAKPDFDVDGEFQFDAAFSKEVGSLKAPGSKVAGQANTFIFPDINAGNIGYKIAQRLGGFEAIGPILQGLNAPINDLSRGCNAEEVYKMAIVTAGMA
jgi:phosphate acetyltransferase